MLVEIPKPTDDLDLFKRKVCMAISRLATSKLGQEASPKFAGLSIGGSSISSVAVGNWNAAYSWGNHAEAGYLTSETDPVFTASDAYGITSTDISNWNTAYGWGDHSAVGYLTSESDPVFTASDAAGITAGDISNWNTAYGWGDHSAVGYLTTESDPVFTASDAASITSSDISNWNTAYSWGDHNGLYDPAGTAGDAVEDHESTYDHSLLHPPVTIPTPSNGLALNGQEISLPTTATPTFAGLTIDGQSITPTSIANWNTAYGWGNHAGLYDSLGSATTAVDDHESTYDHSQLHDPVTIPSSPNGLSLNGQEISLPTTASPTFASLTIDSQSITSTSISNWNTAYSWGDHSGLYDDAGAAEDAVGDHESTYDHSKLHDPVTIPASPNGLSLTGQEISLPTTATPRFAALSINAAVDATAKLFVTGSSFPVATIHRITSLNDAVGSGYRLWTESTGDMKDGFGGGIVFSLSDNGIGVTNVARIAAYRDGNDTTGALGFDVGGTSAVFSTMAMHLRANGTLGLGIYTPEGKAHFTQGDSAAAIPVQVLEQLDVDEPFLKLIGTAASADLTRSIVKAGDVSTATLQGYVKVEVRDDGNQITDQDYFIPIYTLA